MSPVAHLLSAWRSRLATPMENREAIVAGTLGLGYLAAAVAVSLALPWGRELDPLVALGLFAAYVGVSRIRFDVGAGYVSAEQLVFVPLLFVVPLPLILVLVPVAFALSDLPDFLAGRAHRDRWMNALADSWFALGSVSVLGFFAPGAPELQLAPVYLGALAAQVTLGTAAAMVREHFVGRVSVRDEIRSAMAAYQLDVMLSPVGFAIAFAAAALSPVALAALVPAAWAAAALSRMHRARCDRLVAEHDAYWRRFLQDARRLEAMAHREVSKDWRSTPELALAIGAELGLPMDARVQLAQAAQAAAPSVAAPETATAGGRPLAAERRLRIAAALIEGRLCGLGAADAASRIALDRVSHQAELVRSSGEHFDGTGLPRHLRGEEIPLGARILACCRAYSSLTAGGPDRTPMSGETAIEELRRAAGSRFDPVVVDAVSRALRRDDLGSVPSPARSPWLLDQLRPSAAASMAGRPGLG